MQQMLHRPLRYTRLVVVYSGGRDRAGGAVERVQGRGAPDRHGFSVVIVVDRFTGDCGECQRDCGQEREWGFHVICLLVRVEVFGWQRGNPAKPIAGFVPPFPGQLFMTNEPACNQTDGEGGQHSLELRIVQEHGALCGCTAGLRNCAAFVDHGFGSEALCGRDERR